MNNFEDAYEAWRSTAFPVGSARDTLDELHADLALVDTWVAESVIPFAETGRHQPARVDVIEELRRLRARANELAQVGDADDKRLAESYHKYAGILLSVYEGFLARTTPGS